MSYELTAILFISAANLSLAIFSSSKLDRVISKLELLIDRPQCRPTPPPDSPTR